MLGVPNCLRFDQDAIGSLLGGPRGLSRWRVAVGCQLPGFVGLLGLSNHQKEKGCLLFMLVLLKCILLLDQPVQKCNDMSYDLVDFHWLSHQL